ncbi:MAG: sensor histidine kinase [Thermomicrobiales bacterium]|nr:sensor histidine kinase [Thermomicrobiales bacterium]
MTRNRLTRCGITEDAAREDELYRVWYYRFLAIFGAITVALIVFGLFVPEMSGARRALLVASLLFLIAWFWFVGRWNLIASDLHAVVYLLGNMVAICVAIRLWNTTSILLFGIYWLGFAYLYTRPAIIYALLLTIGIQLGFGNTSLFTEFNSGTVAAIALLLLITGFSGMMAKYIESFQQESERNRELLAQLQQAQASLVEQEREAGVVQERQRLAGEIHDTVAQQFTSIIANLRAAEEMERNGSDQASRHRHLALEAAQQGLKDSRAMLSAMQPAVSQSQPLDQLLRDIISRSDQPGITFVEEGQARAISRVQETILVRALQEALRNIQKHAVANVVTVTLSWLEDEVLLDIADDGVGFDIDAIALGEEGFRLGLVTMQHRIESAGGTVVLDSAPGEGASLTVSFPLAEVNQ